MQRDSSLCSPKKPAGNDEVNNITLMSFWKIACLCTGIHLIKKAVQRNNKLRNVSVVFVENSEHASGKIKTQPCLLTLIPFTHRLIYSQALMH